MMMIVVLSDIDAGSLSDRGTGATTPGLSHRLVAHRATFSGKRFPNYAQRT
jgi:hypothetical protein